MVMVWVRGDVMQDFTGKEITVGCTVVVHPKGLSAVSEHLVLAEVTRLTSKCVFVKYYCEYLEGTYWSKRKVGDKEYPRKPEQVYVV